METKAIQGTQCSAKSQSPKMRTLRQVVAFRQWAKQNSAVSVTVLALSSLTLWYSLASGDILLSRIASLMALAAAALSLAPLALYNTERKEAAL